jgi:DNA invertase Pin-like site-specific DNA recombinase
MVRVYGYARVTASRPDPAGLAAELEAAGATEIFVDKISGRGLRQRRRLLDTLGINDTLVLPGLHFLGTTFDDVLSCLALLVDRGIAVRILDVGFETGGKADRAYRDLLQLLSGARSTLRSETIKANLAAAREKGGKAAGKEAMLKPEQWPRIRARIQETTLEIVAQELGVHRQTLWTYRRRMKERDAAST